MIKGEKMGKLESIKGFAFIRLENSKEEIVPKNIYLKMISAGRKVTLLKEGLHWDELR